MADNTKIEWTEATWNPIVGCSVVSPGCTNCYAMKMAARLQKMNRTRGTGSVYVNPYDGTTIDTKAGAVWSGKVALAPEHILTIPLRRKKPTVYFVNSMGDVFHESVPSKWIDQVFSVMSRAPQHTFQILTKRADRMKEYLTEQIQGQTRNANAVHFRIWCINDEINKDAKVSAWPLPNVWIGVSAEDQRRADERIPDLLATPAAVRWVSAEPLLGALDLRRYLTSYDDGSCPVSDPDCTGRDGDCHDACEPRPRIDWVVTGGESGPSARPMHPDWARSIRDQCAAASVPYFFKQWGEWFVIYDRDNDDPDWRQCPHAESSRERYLNIAGGHGFHGERVVFVRQLGKKRAGRLLDGCEHNDMPEVRT